MDECARNLLNELFASNANAAPNAVKFRAKHHEQLDLLDRLQNEGYIAVRNEKYFVQLASLRELSKKNHRAESLLFLCEHIFGHIRTWYLANAGEQLETGELVRMVDMPAAQVRVAVSYMSESGIFDGWSGSAEGEITSIRPSERILRFEAFDDVLNEIELQWKAPETSLDESTTHIRPAGVSRVASVLYVDPVRIDEIANLQSDKFDFSRVVKICEELNSSFEGKNYFAVGALLRALLDHVPPVFGFQSFRAVANSYGGRSIRGSLLHLENSSRKISDSLLHQQIRASESLPSRVMVDFSNDLDVLLAELIRVTVD